MMERVIIPSALTKTSSVLKQYQVDLVLLGVAAVWGGSYLAAKVLTEHASVLAVLALRFLIATAAMAIVCGLRRERRPGARELAVGVFLGLTQASILSLETYGVTFTSATNAGLIISLTIIFTPILESVAARDWLPRPFFIATVIAVVGVALLVSGNGFHAPATGDLLMLGAAAVRSIHVTAMARLTTGKEYSSVTLTLIQSAVCAVMYTAVDIPGTITAIESFGPEQWIGALYLGLACSVFAFLAQIWAIRRTSAARASLLMGTEPVWAVLVGVTLGAESLGWIGLAGAVLIIGGTYWAQRLETSHRTAARGVPEMADRGGPCGIHAATRSLS